MPRRARQRGRETKRNARIMRRERKNWAGKRLVKGGGEEMGKDAGRVAFEGLLLGRNVKDEIWVGDKVGG